MAIIYGARAITIFWIAGLISWALFHMTNYYANFEKDASLSIYLHDQEVFGNLGKSTKRKISGASTAFGGNVPGGVGSRNSGLNHLTLDDQRMVHGHFTTEGDGSLSMARGSNIDESFGRAKDSFSMRPSSSKTFPRDSFQSNISSLQTFSSNQSRSNSLDGFGGPEIKMLGEGGGA